MSLLKYIFIFFLFFVSLAKPVEAKWFYSSPPKNFYQDAFEFPHFSNESYWLGLLHFKENTKLAATSNSSPSILKSTFCKNPDLVESWKVLDDLGADDALRRNPEALEYLAKGRSDKILLNVEELLGGHSKARHGSHIPMSEMEQRVLGTHPTMPQSRSALKFNTDAMHEASVNKAFKEHKAEIEAHFASGGGYKEWDSQLSGPIGEGYYNSGTRSNPVVNQVTTDKVKIAFDVDPNSPSGYKMISAYPWYEIP